MPAVLLAQAARAPSGSLPRGEILQGVLGIAEDLAQRVAVAVLLLDPFDTPTSRMWQARGFRPVLDAPRKGRQPRLWRALQLSVA